MAGTFGYEMNPALLSEEDKKVIKEQIYKKLSDQGYMTYDFFLPGLVIDAIENKRSNYLVAWTKEYVLSGKCNVF